MERLLRVVVVLVVVVAVIALLFQIVFPWVERTFVDDPTLGAQRTVAVDTTSDRRA